MASACHYHPNAKGSATCTECRQHICDQCRLRGKEGRCASCHDIAARGGTKDSRGARVMCLNHAGTPTDTFCKQCRKPHCVACLNSSSACFRCAMSASRSPTGPLKARGTTKLELPPEKKGLAALPPKALLGGGAAVAMGGLVLFGLLSRTPAEQPAPAFMGPSGVAIVAPTVGPKLHGMQMIKLDVRSKEAVEKVELNIDGKYWDKWDKERKPPYQSEWPTGIFKNGTHEVVAIVYYRGGRRMAADKRHFVVKNK